MVEFPTDLMPGAGDRFTNQIAGPWSVPTRNRENRVRTVEFYKIVAVPSGAAGAQKLQLIFEIPP
jgi:hypothetical protein